MKLAAAEAIPTLLQVIEGAELKTIERLRVVHTKLDELAKAFGMPPSKWSEGA